jgi:hypothetical protein
MPKSQLLDAAHTASTVAANGITLATILGWLPHIAAILGICWYVILIIEKKTNRPMHTWTFEDFWAWVKRKFSR